MMRGPDEKIKKYAILSLFCRIWRIFLFVRTEDGGFLYLICVMDQYACKTTEIKEMLHSVRKGERSA